MRFDASPTLMKSLQNRLRQDPRVVRQRTLKLGEKLEDVAKPSFNKTISMSLPHPLCGPFVETLEIFQWRQVNSDEGRPDQPPLQRNHNCLDMYLSIRRNCPAP
jgi:hypothetical protein